MAIKPKVNYAGKIDITDPNYPEGKAQNVTAPGDGTGTPLEQAWINDLFGLQQKLLAAAVIVPSGNPDDIVNSDYFDALNKLFQRCITHADTGAAGAYVLACVTGADIATYPDGHIITFKAVNGNPGGASTVDVGAIGAEDLTLPSGAALPANTITAGQYVRAVYDLANTRYEYLDTAASIAFDDTAASFTAADLQAAILALDNGTARVWANFNGTGAIAIRRSFNVSGLVDNGVGDYTLLFATAQPNANYVTTVSPGAGVGGNFYSTNVPAAAPTVAGVRLVIGSAGAAPAATDVAYVNVVVHGD